MFESFEVPEQAYRLHSRIAIFRYDKKNYGAKIIDEFVVMDKEFMVKDMKLIIPLSHVRQVGEDYFGKFLASAFKLMSKYNCCHPLSVLKPLRKKLRRIKKRLVQINPNNSALRWYLMNIFDMVKDMWSAARNNCVRYLCEQRAMRKDTEVLNAMYLC